MILAGIPFVPFLGAVLLAALGRRARLRTAAAVGCSAALGAFLLGLRAFLVLLREPQAERVIDETVFPWIQSGGFSAPLHLALDPLGAVMVLTVTGVGLLIHVYAAGYMAEDRSPGRFFAEMNLFLAFMLTLVLARNLLLLYVGWEGVGLCSYLLIGFWYERPKAADAALKAILVNRIGDAGFLIGLVLLSIWSGGAWTLGFPELALKAPSLGSAHAAVVGLLLFWGATAKSAQIPLYVWLPDAMEGPTPVSALIHAATMVTAGVYMTARLGFLWAEAPWVASLIACVGALTALWAALMALAERDLKRILAYSTISQLGYMFIGVGVGIPEAGIFHLMTHAFFKALLFLGAGSVMHGLAGETDIYKMGGLKDRMPWTWLTFGIASLALAGCPGFSGFYSKDLILWSAWAQGHRWIWLVGILTAGLTAFYIFRAYFVAFYGDPRTDLHAHESPPVMTVPLALLALGAILAGYVGFPRSLGGHDALGGFLAPLLGAPPEAEHASTEVGFLLVSSAVALLGIGAAWWVYRRRPEVAGRLRAAVPAVAEMIEGKFYVDDFYHEAFVRPARALASFSLRVVDLGVLDRLVDGGASLVRAVGGALRRLQAGEVQSYAAYLALGVLWLLWRIHGR